MLPASCSSSGGWPALFSARVARLGKARLLHPFYAPAEWNEPLLADLLAACSELEPIAFNLDRFERFPGGVLWLAPAPAGPLVRMIERLAGRYPDCPRYGGAYPDVVAHATVAESGEPTLLDRIAAAVEPALPVRVTPIDAWLMHRTPDGWAVRARLPFAPGDEVSDHARR